MGASMVRRILRRREVENVTGKPRSSIYAGIAAGTFPKPIPLGEKAVGWLEDEIIQWQKDRIAERDRPTRHALGRATEVRTTRRSTSRSSGS